MHSVPKKVWRTHSESSEKFPWKRVFWVNVSFIRSVTGNRKKIFDRRFKHQPEIPRIGNENADGFFLGHASARLQPHTELLDYGKNLIFRLLRRHTDVCNAFRTHLQAPCIRDRKQDFRSRNHLHDTDDIFRHRHGNPSQTEAHLRQQAFLGAFLFIRIFPAP